MMGWIIAWILLSSMGFFAVLACYVVHEVKRDAWAREKTLRGLLVELIDAVEPYEADQSGATDPRCGEVQPITVEEGLALCRALSTARAYLYARETA